MSAHRRHNPRAREARIAFVSVLVGGVVTMGFNAFEALDDEPVYYPPLVNEHPFNPAARLDTSQVERR